ncbi:MAG: checkpoint protein Hus1/Mec3 [Piptocephalis tieghemiana]|nr:MAG: checkpoint protein Hus1/Mec3 [Piptocephalis tieghemiana]
MTEGAGGEAQVWARLEPDMIFDCEEGSHDPYTVVSPAPGDEINLEIPLESLLRAMHSTLPSRGATTPPESSMELVCSTGGGPSHMVISIQSPTRSGSHQWITQKVPVRMLSKESASLIREPMVPPPQVAIIMPDLSEVRKVAERLGKMHEMIQVEGSQAGTLTLSIEGDGGMLVSSTWKDLIVPELESDEASTMTSPGTPVGSSLDPASDTPVLSRATISQKDLINFLWGWKLKPKDVVCCILEGHAMVFFLYVNQGLSTHDGGEDSLGLNLLTYYIPNRSP